MVYAKGLCLSICLSLASQSSIKMAEHLELIIGIEATLVLSYILGYLQK